jgi:hypothetical protein
MFQLSLIVLRINITILLMFFICVKENMKFVKKNKIEF